MTRRKKKKPLKVVGQTTDGLHVVQGSFFYVTARGIPLEILFQTLKERGYVIDWLDLYDMAIKEWTTDTLMNKLQVALYNVFGKEYRDTVLKRLVELRLS